MYWTASSPADDDWEPSIVRSAGARGAQPSGGTTPPSAAETCVRRAATRRASGSAATAPIETAPQPRYERRTAAPCSGTAPRYRRATGTRNAFCVDGSVTKSKVISS